MANFSSKRGIKGEKEIIEDKVIDLISRRSEGRLIVFKDEKTSCLVVKKKAEYKKAPIYLQVEGNSKLKEGNIFEKEVQKLDAKDNLYLMFVYFDRITEELSNYFWIIPSLLFQDLTPDAKFSAPLDPLVENECRRFIIDQKKFPELLWEMVLSPEDFEFPTAGFIKKTIDLKALKRFIVEARIHTFAGGGSPAPYPRLLGAVQFEYQKKNYFYRDVYFEGREVFMGQEVVYKDEKPIWSMIYCGQTVSDKEILNFLKEALLESASQCRLGETAEFGEERLKYKDGGGGSLEKFRGKEEIYQDNKKVYEFTYQGALLF